MHRYYVITTVLMLVGCLTLRTASGQSGAAAHSAQDRYTVDTSGGDTKSPFQPPPGSALWKQQQRLAALHNLKKEIAIYKAAQSWYILNEQIDNNKWLRLYENTIDVLGGVAARVAPNQKLPDGQKPPDDVPRWENEKGDANSLDILQHAMAYDAKKLGILSVGIVPKSGTEQELLDQLSHRIDTEAARISTALTNAGVQPPAFEPPAIPGSASSGTPSSGGVPATAAGVGPHASSSPAFNPSTLSPEERQGWLRNQALVGGETLGRAGQGSTPALGNLPQQDPRGGVAADVRISPKDFQAR